MRTILCLSLLHQNSNKPITIKISHTLFTAIQIFNDKNYSNYLDKQEKITHAYFSLEIPLDGFVICNSKYMKGGKVKAAVVIMAL